MGVEVPAPGGKINEGAPFRVVRIAVLTVSDTRDEESDTSGKVLADRVVRDGHDLAARAMVKDSVDEIRAQVNAWIDDPTIDALISTAAQALTGRDVTRKRCGRCLTRKSTVSTSSGTWCRIRALACPRCNRARA